MVVLQLSLATDLAVGPWAGSSLCLQLAFCLCNMGITSELTSAEMQGLDCYADKALSTGPGTYWPINNLCFLSSVRL